jgi:HrpA-like RNA helicase
LLRLSSSRRSKATKNPSALLASCLDPPDPATLRLALQHLWAVRALKPSDPQAAATLVRAGLAALPTPGLLVPTVLGRLLSCLPVRVDAGLLAVACAKRGLVREGAALAALLSTSPLPIESAFQDPDVLAQRLRHFGGSDLFSAASASAAAPGGAYGGGGSGKVVADPDACLEAHLGAVMAHSQWADALRCADPNAKATHADRLRAATPAEEVDRADDDARSSGSATQAAHAAALAWAAENDKDEAEEDAEEGALYSEAVWCAQGGLSSVSLAAVAECAACIEAALLSDELNPVSP